VLPGVGRKIIIDESIKGVVPLLGLGGPTPGESRPESPPAAPARGRREP
jgi:hypothetical protein